MVSFLVRCYVKMSPPGAPGGSFSPYVSTPPTPSTPTPLTLRENDFIAPIPFASSSLAASTAGPPLPPPPPSRSHS